MDSTRILFDSIKAVVNVSNQCQSPQNECNADWQDVAIVAIIAVTAIIICYQICGIIKMRKQEGIKKIIKDIVKNECIKEEHADKHEQA